MQITQSIDLNLSIDGIPPQLHMPQGDGGRIISASLWDRATIYSPPDGTMCMLRFRKPDGTGGLYDTAEDGTKISLANNVATIPVALQVLAVGGPVRCQVELYAPAAEGELLSANRLATFAFVLFVAPSVYPDAEIISGDYINIVSEELKAALDKVVDDLNEHLPRINADGKWELWDTSKNAYVATEYTAIGENGARGLGWYQHVVTTSNQQFYLWDGWLLAPKWGEGDWLYDPDNGNVGLCTSRTDKADGSGGASFTYKGTLKGKDGTKWWTYAYPIGITAALENIMSKSNLPDAAIGDYVLHTMNNAGIVFEITGETADGSSWVVKEKCTLRGKDGTTPHIGENGNWYIGDTDTGVSAYGAGHIFKVIVVDGTGGPDTLSADKTFAEIKSAYTDGNIVVVLHGSALYELAYMSDVRAEFTRVNATYYEVMSCTNSGAPQEVDGWQLNRTKRINYDTKYGDIGNKTVPVAIKELQDKSAPAVTDTDAGKYLHVNSSTKELEWAAAEAATHETAGIVKPSADFDIASDGTLSLYKDIAVNSLTLNKGAVYEIGSAVTGLDVAWALNKTPAEQTISVPEYAVTIENIGADVRSTTGLTGNAATQWNGVKTQEKTSGTLTVVLTVKDDRGEAASKTARIQWLNGVYTGAAEAPATIDSAFIRTLTKSLQSGKGKTFTVNAATGAYIWYACPVSYGTPNFNVGGFDGGFSKVATLDYTNAVGYTEEYQVWRSDNAGLGSTTVKVS